MVAMFMQVNGVAAQDRQDKKIAKHLINEWKFVEAIGEDGENIQVPGDLNYLKIAEISNAFTIDLDDDSGMQTGKWKLTDDLLVLNYDPADTIVFIDSALYRVIKRRSEIVFFNHQKEIASIGEDHFETDSYSQFYKVISCSSDSLVIFSDGVTYTLLNEGEIAVSSVAVDGGFNVKAILRGLLGMLVILGIAFIFSTNRRAISWRLVAIGISSQVVIAFAVLKIPFVQTIFGILGKVFVKILDFSKIGGNFLFESFATGQVEIALLNFAFQILPTIIFFSALTSILFYYGIIQKVVYVMAWIMTRILKISGAESLSACGNIFVGQTEAPLLIKEYLAKMNKSEIMLVMTGGMATIAGGVLAIYIGLLGGTDPAEQMLFAKHLLSASVMAAPGAVVAAKMLVPQTEKIESSVAITRDKVGSNFLEALSNGTTQGLKLAVNVAAMLLVFIAFIAFINYILLKAGDWTTLNNFVIRITDGQYNQVSLQFIMGYALSPLAWTMGVCTEDMTLVAQLLGEKTILNEMIAFISLKEYIASGAFAENKSIIMATYMLCGFANFSSIGIQLGGIGALAPGKKKMLSQLGFRALVGGTIASLLSATIVGIILG